MISLAHIFELFTACDTLQTSLQKPSNKSFNYLERKKDWFYLQPFCVEVWKQMHLMCSFLDYNHLSSQSENSYVQFTICNTHMGWDSICARLFQTFFFSYLAHFQLRLLRLFCFYHKGFPPRIVSKQKKMDKATLSLWAFHEMISFS